MFQPAPFSTNVGARVERATQGGLLESDWQLNMEICDMINSNPSINSKDFLRAVKKRLQSSKASHHEIELTIILLETASKNCVGLNSLISKKDFCQDVLYAIVSTKRGKRPCTKDIEDKVLNLIDNIANELEGGAGQTTPIYNPLEICKLRSDLKAKGVVFPSQRGISDAELLKTTHSGPRMESVSSSGVTIQARVPSPVTQELDSLSKDLLEAEDMSKLLSDMLEEFKNSGTSLSPENYEVIFDMLESVKQQQQKIATASENVADETMLISLVSKNEDLLKVMEIADNFLKNEKIVSDEPRYQVNVEPKKSTNDLINFDDSSTIEQPVQNTMQNNGSAHNELLDIFSAPDIQTVPISPQVTTNDLIGDIQGINLNQRQPQPQGFQSHQRLGEVLQQPGYEYPLQQSRLVENRVTTAESMPVPSLSYNNQQSDSMYPVQQNPPVSQYHDSGFQSQVQTFDGWMQNSTFTRQENPQYTRDSPILTDEDSPELQRPVDHQPFGLSKEFTEYTDFMSSQSQKQNFK